MTATFLGVLNLMPRFLTKDCGARQIAAVMPAAWKFTFICGQDDYLVGRVGQERFGAMASETADEFSREVISGFAGNVDEVADSVNRFREAVQTVPLFGGRRVVWLKDVNFLSETVTGRAEGTLKLVADLQEILESVDPASVGALVTAAPVDRRRSFLKWCEKNADYVLIDSDGNAAEALAGIALAEAESLGAEVEPGAIELLIAKVGANTRLLVEEVRKLANYASVSGSGRPLITGEAVAELTPNFAEGDFFEAADAFFSSDLQRTLDALHRHFFAGGDARPVLAAFQNRNRLLLQMRALMDSGDAWPGPRGLDGLSKAAAAHTAKYAEAATAKSSYNIFTQHPFYLGKLSISAPPGLKRLIDNQQEFIAAFEEIIRRPNEQEEVLRDMAVRCLA
jgi:DNA polymerase III subunit delta